jgi:hypothetical protein
MGDILNFSRVSWICAIYPKYEEKLLGENINSSGLSPGHIIAIPPPDLRWLRNIR